MKGKKKESKFIDQFQKEYGYSLCIDEWLGEATTFPNNFSSLAKAISSLSIMLSEEGRKYFKVSYFTLNLNIDILDPKDGYVKTAYLIDHVYKKYFIPESLEEWIKILPIWILQYVNLNIVNDGIEIKEKYYRDIITIAMVIGAECLSLNMNILDIDYVDHIKFTFSI